MPTSGAVVLVSAVVVSVVLDASLEDDVESVGAEVADAEASAELDDVVAPDEPSMPVVVALVGAGRVPHAGKSASAIETA